MSMDISLEKVSFDTSYQYDDDDFLLNGDGLFRKASNRDNDQALLKISDPIKVVSRLYNHNTRFFDVSQTSDQHLAIAFFIKPQQQQIETVFPRRTLNQPSQFINDLMGHGFYINLSQKKWLIEFLNRQFVERTMYFVSKPGWTANLDAFVFPDQTYAWDQDNKEKLKLITQTNRFKTAGSVDDWHQHIVQHCSEHSLFVFALAVAFTPPLLRLINMDSFCVNFYGESSKGKTTALQIASSVWGCGSEPSQPDSYIYNWNATGNALNALAAGSSDVLLAIDELGSFKNDSLGQVIYALSGGKSRKGVKANNELRDDSTWNTVLLSTSEISGRQKIEEDGQVYTGQLNRFIDIPVNQLTMKNVDADLVNKIKDNCSKFYGSAGMYLIETITHYSEGKDDLIGKIMVIHKKHYDHLLSMVEKKSVNLTSELTRSIRRFALIFTAADLVIVGNILGLYDSPVHEGFVEVQNKILPQMEQVFLAWLNELNLEPRSSIDRIISSVSDFVLANQAKFVDTTSQTLPSTVIGFYHRSKKLFLLTDETFAKACYGFSAIESAKALKEHNLLHLQDKKRHKSSFDVELISGKRKVRFYAIKAGILGEES